MSTAIKRGEGKTMRRIIVVTSLTFLAGCGGLSVKQEIEVPTCDYDGSPGSCALPEAFLWRNASELWGYSPNTGPYFSLRKDGKWTFDKVCDGLGHSRGLGFKGEEIFYLCGEKLLREDASGNRTEVAMPEGEWAGSITPLSGDFLVVGYAGYYGWNGSGFELVAPLSSIDPNEQGAGLTRSAFYSTSGNFWNGTEWTQVGQSTSGSAPTLDVTRIRFADGLMCAGLYMMNGIHWTQDRKSVV